jgi:hypothetical protein
MMATGAQKPISQVQVGDQVAATDPETGTTTAQPVTDLHLNQDTDLADVTVTDANGTTAVVHTTQHHPFWNETRHAWTDAAALHPGDHLHTPDDHPATVTAVREYQGSHPMYNLTVRTIHTYYVIAGTTQVLVHNAGGCITVPNRMSPAEVAHAQDLGNHSGAGSFVGQTQKDMPGIDGWMDGVPTSLKDTQSSSPAAVLRNASKAESQLANAGYAGGVVSIRATNVSDAAMRDFISKGPFASITQQGTVGQIFVKTDSGWIYCVNGTCV